MGNEVTHPVGEPFAAFPSTEGVPRATVCHMVARLEERFPTAPAALVWCCVNDAVDSLRHARIQLYLPILIERTAGRALGDAIRSGSSGG